LLSELHKLSIDLTKEKMLITNHENIFYSLALNVRILLYKIIKKKSCIACRKMQRELHLN